jgi:signal transduction histidine kinase
MIQAAHMKRKRNKFSQCYWSALRKHLKHGADAQLQPALKMGREAVALGVQTLELAQIHERAIATMELPAGQHRLIKKAERFFNEAITALVETHRASRQGKKDLNRLNEKLGRCTAEMAVTKRQLERGIIRRKCAEAALKKNGEHYTTLLQASLQLQKGLRQLAHKGLSAMEKERTRISRQLQDEIGQTLLAINVRLLTLKTAARGNTAELRKEIFGTQRLVKKSVQSVTLYARELNLGHA